MMKQNKMITSQLT